MIIKFIIAAVISFFIVYFLAVSLYCFVSWSHIYGDHSVFNPASWGILLRITFLFFWAICFAHVGIYMGFLEKIDDN